MLKDQNSALSLSLLEEPNWQQLSYLFAFGFEEQIPSKICILSYFVWLYTVMFNLLYVFDLFSERRQSAVSDLFMLKKHWEK